jgi:putative phosphoribosyl transferase
MAASRMFADRPHAGRRLVEVLPELEEGALVLGLARGGVPVAAELARSLAAPLDVLVVRKVGHPRQPEYALGAVSEDGVSLPEDLPEAVTAPQVERARRQAREMRGERPRAPMAGRTVVVVDDGLATGRSMAAALATVARYRAARVVMAVPVAAGPGLRALAAEWEVCAAAVVEPPEFFAVGQFYADFSQVDDSEVVALLEAADAAAGG